jgi:acetylornithine deacetylase/succinyl-diaminopimelate desuccinylase-like protein
VLLESWQEVAGHPVAARARARLTGSGEELVNETIAVCEIPAPTFHEEQRARYVAQQFSAAGLDGVSLDALGNVTGLLPGAQGGPMVMLAAHMDTVFEGITQIQVQRSGDKLYAPGVRDNSAAVAALIVLARVLVATGVRTRRPLVLAGTVGEEGLGDLRGMRALMDSWGDRLQYVIGVDGALGGIVNYGIGSRRLEVTTRARGGHSWGDFGAPSAIHAMGRMIAAISDIRVPLEPKTTFNVGKIQGGTSVNSIAAHATMLVDMRSVDAAHLRELEEEVRRHLVAVAAAGRVELEVTVVGDRPSGSIAPDHELVRLVTAVQKKLGIHSRLSASSTDANIPLSRGIPAVTIGVTTGANNHAPTEHADIAPMVTGLLQLFDVAMALVGLQ